MPQLQNALVLRFCVACAQSFFGIKCEATPPNGKIPDYTNRLVEMKFIRTLCCTFFAVHVQSTVAPGAVGIPICFTSALFLHIYTQDQYTGTMR
jgi:hypothetical protein